MNSVVIGADVVAGEILARAVKAKSKADALVAMYGAKYLTAVKAAASGRPGPRAVTGDYRRSINMELVRTPLGSGAVIGTSAPQGRRLEYGFVGTDSLGRHYNQPPFPHFAPPLPKIVQELAMALEAAMAA